MRYHVPQPFEALLSKQLISRHPNLEVVRSSPPELSFPYNIVGFGEVREL